MLHAEKAQLESNLAVEVLRVRDRELQFYSDSIATIGTQAALLAALSISVLTSMDNELKAPPGGYLSEATANDWGIRRGVAAGDTGIGSWTTWTWLEQIAHVLELLAVVACLTTQLGLIQRCALVEIGGLKLALRGPDGSAQKALHHMRKEVKRAQRMMIRGVQFLAVTIMLMLLKDLPLPLGTLPFVVAAIRFVDSNLSQNKLAAVFKLDEADEHSSTPGGPDTPARRKRVAKYLAKFNRGANRWNRRLYRCVTTCICCEDDEEIDVVDRMNSRPRCAPRCGPHHARARDTTTQQRCAGLPAARLERRALWLAGRRRTSYKHSSVATRTWRRARR
jgi:hypothetical protein